MSYPPVDASGGAWYYPPPQIPSGPSAGARAGNYIARGLKGAASTVQSAIGGFMDWWRQNPRAGINRLLELYAQRGADDPELDAAITQFAEYIRQSDEKPDREVVTLVTNELMDPLSNTGFWITHLLALIATFPNASNLFSNEGGDDENASSRTKWPFRDFLLNTSQLQRPGELQYVGYLTTIFGRLQKIVSDERFPTNERAVYANYAAWLQNERAAYASEQQGRRIQVNPSPYKPLPVIDHDVLTNVFQSAQQLIQRYKYEGRQGSKKKSFDVKDISWRNSQRTLDANSIAMTPEVEAMIRQASSKMRAAFGATNRRGAQRALSSAGYVTDASMSTDIQNEIDAISRVARPIGDAFVVSERGLPILPQLTAKLIDEGVDQQLSSEFYQGMAGTALGVMTAAIGGIAIYNGYAYNKRLETALNNPPLPVVNDKGVVVMSGDTLQRDIKQRQAKFSIQTLWKVIAVVLAIAALFGVWSAWTMVRSTKAETKNRYLKERLASRLGIDDAHADRLRELLYGSKSSTVNTSDESAANFMMGDSQPYSSSSSRRSSTAFGF